MKITQEVRDFAAKQNASADTFLAAEEGTAEMSEKFREGGEIYLPAAELHPSASPRPDLTPGTSVEKMVFPTATGGMMARYLFLLGLFLLTSACAGRPGVTPYAPMSALGGFREEEAEPGVWRVVARSNGKAGADHAWNMAEYRAAELLKAQGFSHVQVLDRHGRWELSDDLGGGRRRVLSDSMELTVRGAHDESPPIDCRAPDPGSCWTLGIDAMMATVRPRLSFPHDLPASDPAR